MLGKRTAELVRRNVPDARVRLTLEVSTHECGRSPSNPTVHARSSSSESAQDLDKQHPRIRYRRDRRKHHALSDEQGVQPVVGAASQKTVGAMPSQCPSAPSDLGEPAENPSGR